MKTILIVDDIETNRKLLRQMLRIIGGVNVIEAVDGKEAVTIFEKEFPDLILMDINMPVMSGYESTSIIKSMAGENYTPIIFVTALSAEASLALALASGGDDFISKPFNKEVLESKMNAHLRIRELNQQVNDKNNDLTDINKYLTHEQNLIEHFFNGALQQSFLDQKYIKYHMSSMSSFNGDLLLVTRSQKGGIYLVMGDFTGHGLSAAMGTLPVAMIFFKMAEKGLALGDIAREVNRQLNKFMPSGMFFAATLLFLNDRGDKMSVWMGGMPESYWLGKDGELKGEIFSQHMPLGILPDSGFVETVEVFNVEKGDKVYLYSDGVNEARNPDGEMFGNDRLKELLCNHGDDRFDEVLNNLQAFTTSGNQNDDVTLIELTCDESLVLNNDEENGNEAYALPWHMSTAFSATEMRDDEIIIKLANMLCTHPALASHKGILQILLSEIYSNILDHSILGLNSDKKENAEEFSEYYKKREQKLQKLEDALIEFDFSLMADSEKQYLQMIIKDNGAGYKGHVVNDSDVLPYGRGLEIIHGLSESISFSDEGKTLEVLYLLQSG